MTAPAQIHELVDRFERDRHSLAQDGDNEFQLRQSFVNPFFAALGWDVGNRSQVLHETALKSGGSVKHPDYTFLAGKRRAFYVETKRPAIDISKSVDPALQLRSYGWSGNTAVGILTNFAEFAVYDCRINPQQGDLPAKARILYLTSAQYVDHWRQLHDTLSYEAVQQGKHRSILDAAAKGVLPVDAAFLRDMEGWRSVLAKELHKQALFVGKDLSQRELNLLVQRTIDRIVFLRIVEDRNPDEYGRLERIAQGHNVYQQLKNLYRAADAKYNSGLFHFERADKSRPEADTLSMAIYIPDEVLRNIIYALYPPQSRYQFSVISADILGQVYERFLGNVIEVQSDGHETRVSVEEKPEVQRAGGVYYTPEYIVDYIVENTVGKLLEGKTPQEAAKLRVLDPACGSGSFLAGAYQYLLDWHLDFYSQNPRKHKNVLRSVGGDYALVIPEKRRILLNSIYGVDLDQNAVEVSKLSLLLKMLENEDGGSGVGEEDGPILPDLRDNIKWGNSLVGSDFYDGADVGGLTDDELQRVMAFDWDGAGGFAEVTAAGGFDAVIGNPPYVRIQTMKETSPELLPYYKSKYVTARRGSYDIYVVFVERGMQLLNEQGLLGYILPHKFFNSKYGEPLRGHIAKGKHLSHIVHFGDQQVFDGATTYTCLMFLSNAANSRFSVEKVTSLENWNKNRASEVGDLSAGRASNAEWNFVVGDASGVFYKLADMPTRLADVADRVFQGLVTGADSVFILEHSEGGLYSASTQSRHDLEAELLHPLCKGSVNLRRYHVDNITKSILFPYKLTGSKAELLTADEMQEQYPNAWEYLLANRTALESRERGKWKHSQWYAFGRNQNLNQMEQTKLLVPSLANRSAFTLDIDDHFYFVGSGGGGGGGYGITLRPDCKLSYHYLLGLLNSRTLEFILKRVSSPFRGGYYAYNRQYIEQLPIRTIDFEDATDAAMHDEMVRLVERMLALHKGYAGLTDAQRAVVDAQIARVDRQIDALVYRLYGLSEEEVGVVEG